MHHGDDAQRGTKRKWTLNGVESWPRANLNNDADDFTEYLAAHAETKSNAIIVSGA